jgi:hypothetical protein
MWVAGRPLSIMVVLLHHEQMGRAEEGSGKGPDARHKDPRSQLKLCM